MSTKILSSIQRNSDEFYADVRDIITLAECEVCRAINIALVQRNWLVGKRIAKEKLKGKNRAIYDMVLNLFSRTIYFG